uniref:glycosyltransferase n=1 Tax=uncultured Halovibrio sp. TaxID=985049 RepID=UPI0025D4D345
LAFPRSNCTVFQNKDDKSLFIRKNWVDEKRAMLIIGSGVNLTQFTPNFQPIEESRPIQIVMLGRLIWHKGMYEFSQVAEHIRRLHPDVRLVWAGELDLDHPDAVPEQWLSSQTNFDYLGRVSDVPELLRRSDILLFPSVYREGVPRSVMEAAATKIPCVGFDVPGVREAVRHEITGYLVAEGDIDGLTKAVLSMLSDSELRTQMGEQARFLAENEFDINKISADYVQTYRDFGIDIPAFG